MFTRSDKKKKYEGEIKSDSFNLNDIAPYFRYKKQAEGSNPLSDQTYADLGIEEFFSFADRTVSRVGQQYLYSLLRIHPRGKGEIETHEDVIGQLETNEDFRSKLVQALSRLRDPEAYSIVNLLAADHPVTPGTTTVAITVLRFMPALFILSYLTTHIAAFGILFLCFTLLNAVIHYVFKPKSLDYLYSVPQFIKLLNCAEEIGKYPELSKLTKEMPEALSILKPIRQTSLSLRIENKLQGEMAALIWLCTELIHIFFLTEPVSFIRSVSILRDKKQAVEQVYQFIGLTDCLLSVYFFRKSLPSHCLPGQIADGWRLTGEDLYHPLIPDCVANTIRIKDRSVLLNGSNMSGKTTFIRIVGLNTVVAQTLHTAFARQFSLSAPLYIYSALMLADDLSEGKSFYLKEVETIKGMIDLTRPGTANLFLFDEIFKGTNTTERIAAAQAVLSYLNTPDNIIIASTHDTELSALLAGEYDPYHFSEVISGNTFSFDYKLHEGPLYQRNAIRLLEINGFPEAVTKAAHDTVSRLP